MADSSKEVVNKIVNLRKKRIAIYHISKKVGYSFAKTKRILHEELGDDYVKFELRRTIPIELKKGIIRLRRSGYSTEDISVFSGQSVGFVRHCLRNLKFEVIFEDIVSSLSLFDHNELKEECINFFQQIYAQIGKGTKYKVVYKIAPAIIFLYLKTKTILINHNDFSKAAHISKRNLLDSIKFLILTFPAYFKQYRDRDNNALKSRILNSIVAISRQFDFSYDFIRCSIDLLDKFQSEILFTKEGLITATVCVLAMIKLDIRTITFNKLCNKIGVVLSSVQYQVKNNVLSNSDSLNFRGLRQSSKLIKKYL